MAWYGQIVDFSLRGRHGNRMAFIDMGDQLIALSAGRRQPPDDSRYFGLVVDDKEGVRRALATAGVEVQRAGSLDFHDPGGNHVQVVDYRDIQFTETPAVLSAIGLASLGETEVARRELRERGLAGDWCDTGGASLGAADPSRRRTRFRWVLDA